MDPERGPNPFALAEQLLAGIRLSPGQLAQLRALSSKYYTQLAALEQTPGAEDERKLAAVRTLLADIRDLLTDEQRIVYDRNLPRITSAPPGPRP